MIGMLLSPPVSAATVKAMHVPCMHSCQIMVSLCWACSVHNKGALHLHVGYCTTHNVKYTTKANSDVRLHMACLAYTYTHLNQRVGPTLLKPVEFVVLGRLSAMAFDLLLNGREFETHRPLALPGSDIGQVTRTYVPMSPSSITWYRGGNVRLWKRCGLPSITAQESKPWRRRWSSTAPDVV